MLAFQVMVFPRNTNLNDYRFPTDVATTGAALVPRYPGTMLQVANNGAVVHSPDPAALSSEVMFGNMLQAVGVQAVTSYYGMGFKAFTDVAVHRVQRLGLSGRPAARLRASRARRTSARRPAAARDRRRPERAARGRRRRGARTAGASPSAPSR